MNKILLASSFLLLLSGCFDSEEKTYSVSELVEDTELRNEIIAKCDDNPGELALTPNCINAGEAENQASSNNSAMPSIR